MKHAWMNECQCLFQYMLQAGYSPGWSVVNGKNEKTRMKRKNENEKLAKSKTRKGGLGKNEHPADWQPVKANQAKMGQWKESLFPGESKTRKGGSGKNGIEKWKNWKMERTKEWKALTTDANIQCLPSTDAPSNGDLYQRIFQGSLFCKFCICFVIYCPQPWFRCVSQRRSLQGGFLCVYVIARATTCPIFQCFVSLCGTSLPNCKPIMHFQAFIHA